MNELACEVKAVTSLKHPLKVYMNFWGLLGSCDLHDCGPLEEEAKAITGISLPQGLHARLSSPDLQSE